MVQSVFKLHRFATSQDDLDYASVGAHDEHQGIFSVVAVGLS